MCVIDLWKMCGFEWYPCGFWRPRCTDYKADYFWPVDGIRKLPKSVRRILSCYLLDDCDKICEWSNLNHELAFFAFYVEWFYCKTKTLDIRNVKFWLQCKQSVIHRYFIFPVNNVVRSLEFTFIFKDNNNLWLEESICF